ncbi:MAG TPA: hypothetical protein VHG91_00115, partial [Longimicrobium sp.]|nr:hypothetical protein [Longimicrobium sp.]
MRTELYDAVREATAGEFDLLGELDGAAGWMAYLAREASGGALAVLVLEEAPAEAGGQFDLRVLRRLDAREPVGFTTCAACGVENEGWPRFCGACGRDLSGVAPDAAAPGGSAAELLEAVRAAAEGEFEVLGAIPRAEGGGEVYFAREEATGRIVGLTLDREHGDDYALSATWAADDEALAHPATGTAAYAAPEPWAPAPEPEPAPPAPAA